MKVDEIITKKKNIIVIKKTCPYCSNAISLLKKRNIPCETILKDECKDLVDEIQLKYKHKTYPMIFLNGSFVGGFSELENHLK